jgi:hypothetical protein
MAIAAKPEQRKTREVNLSMVRFLDAWQPPLNQIEATASTVRELRYVIFAAGSASEARYTSAWRRQPRSSIPALR